ncbi:MAG: TetR/AcrR family transcriptional regulator [Aureispira sp.]
MKKGSRNNTNTKQRILTTALALFNQEGVASVTLRQIAKATSISQGNLNYYFKKREELVEALYLQLVEEMNTLMAELANETPSLAQLLAGSAQTMRHFYTYRFFMLDFVHIMRQQPDIQAHYQVLTQQRRQQFFMLYEHWIAEGVLRAEAFPEEYVHLYTRSQILGDFWLSSAFTKQQELTPALVEEYNRAIFAQLFPYLTKQGQKEFLTLFS